MNSSNLFFQILGGKGHALLILRPEELGFLRYLRQANVPLNEFEFSWSKVSDIQPQLEKLISKNYFLNLSAKEAFKGYARAYESHSLKQVITNFILFSLFDRKQRKRSYKWNFSSI